MIQDDYIYSLWFSFLTQVHYAQVVCRLRERDKKDYELNTN